MKPGSLNVEPDHLSRKESGKEPSNIEDGFSDARLFKVGMVDDHYEKIVQFLETCKAPEEFTTNQKKQLVVRVAYFQLITGQLYKMGPNEILHRSVLPHDQERILAEVHDEIAGGHYGGCATTKKILRASLWWKTLHKNIVDYAKSCNVCQRMRNPSR